MIEFRKIGWCNFMSTGDEGVEIELNRHRNTLIVGRNGHGKSQLLDALSFALFGRTYRDINVTQAVNAINNKKMLVWIEFAVDSNQEVKIMRGLKPRVFEIWVNGEKLDRAHAREDQRNLEENILGMDFRSFCQIVVVGASSFVQFMSLKNDVRRKVVENVLDISVFSVMKEIAKSQAKVVQSRSQETSSRLSQLKYEHDYMKEQIRSSEARRQSSADMLEKSRKSVDTMEMLQKLRADFNAHLESLRDERSKVSSKMTPLTGYISEFGVKRRDKQKMVDFWKDHDVCPTCEQPITIEFKTLKSEEAVRLIEQYDAAMADGSKHHAELQTRASEIDKEINAVNQALGDTDARRNALESTAAMRKVAEEVSAAEESNRVKLNDLAKRIAKCEQEQAEANAEIALSSVIVDILADKGGIRSMLIKQYVPVINMLINKYLERLDLFVNFELDEDFGEHIRDRHLDDFQYYSFSEGEKQRIDLALLFTWREIARQKNTTATNLLVMDEVFDSSLDSDGTENLLELLKFGLDDDGATVNSTNVFIISHKDASVMEGKFEHMIEFVKSNNFSNIVHYDLDMNVST